MSQRCFFGTTKQAAPRKHMVVCKVRCRPYREQTMENSRSPFEMLGYPSDARITLFNRGESRCVVCHPSICLPSPRGEAQLEEEVLATARETVRDRFLELAERRQATAVINHPRPWFRAFFGESFPVWLLSGSDDAPTWNLYAERETKRTSGSSPEIVLERTVEIIRAQHSLALRATLSGYSWPYFNLNVRSSSMVTIIGPPQGLCCFFHPVLPADLAVRRKRVAELLALLSKHREGAIIEFLSDDRANGARALGVDFGVLPLNPEGTAGFGYFAGGYAPRVTRQGEYLDLVTDRLLRATDDELMNTQDGPHWPDPAGVIPSD